MEYAKLTSSEEYSDRGITRNYHVDNTGTGFKTHSHPWGHLVVCTKGSLKVIIDGAESTLTSLSEPITFPPNSEHSVEVLEDGTEFYTEHPTDISEFLPPLPQ